MARIVKMELVTAPNYDGQEGMTIDGEWLTHVTNINHTELEKYIQLIKSFNSHTVFGISDDPWGFDEDEGYPFRTSGYGLYISSRSDLQKFWEHEKRMMHVFRNRPGYVKGFVGYKMQKVKTLRTNVQRKHYKARQINNLKLNTFNSKKDFPITGSRLALYLANDTRKLYRFSNGRYSLA